jgi:poly(3-hydroxyalkanoate) synthetase
VETHWHYLDNGVGWRLALKQAYDPQRLDPGRRPLAIVPGYGMNGFIFGWHPSGDSMEAYLVKRGFEVWTINMRGQEPSQNISGEPNYGIRDLALVDLAQEIELVREKTRTEADAVDLIGCSLGGSIVFTYASCAPRTHAGSLVAMGAPLVWEKIHPLIRIAFSSPWLAEHLKLKHTRALARSVLPILVRFPKLLSIYMHTQIIDTSDIATLTKTVEDPNPQLNRELVIWLKERHLTIDGRNVTDALRDVFSPLLTVVANGDGIVPPETALSGHQVIGSRVRDVLRAGTKEIPLAHADMFVSYYAQQWVFEPMADWLEARY